MTQQVEASSQETDEPMQADTNCELHSDHQHSYAFTEKPNRSNKVSRVCAQEHLRKGQVVQLGTTHRDLTTGAGKANKAAITTTKTGQQYTREETMH